MKKFLFLATALFFTLTSVTSQTNVSGNITSNTTWTETGSPYVLTGNVGVPANYTLTIEPGVTVQRTGDYQILINGVVQINGTKTDTIRFITDINPPPSPKIFPFAPDTKPFIEFQKSNLNNSSLSYTAFWKSNYQTNHIRLGNESAGSQTNPKNSGTLSISHSNLSNGFVTANDYAAQTQLSIDSSYLYNGFVYAYSAYQDSTTITNSRLINSFVWSSSSNYIRFAGCYLDSVGLYLVSDATIQNCTLHNCKSEPLGSNYGLTTIKNSDLVNTYFNNPYTSFNISDAKFTVNTKLTDSYGNDVQYLLNLLQISIAGVQFADSSSYTVSGINIRGDFNSSGKDTIINNRFQNLYDAVVVNNFAAIRFDSNSFYMPGRYDINNQSTKDFSALYNYYQLQNGHTIDDLIFDQNDDLNYGLVTYTPYISDPVVLPVALIGFTGNAEGQTVSLYWQTGTELNAEEYVVERKVNDEYVVVGIIPAINNPGSRNSYRFIDYTPASGINDYRLKMVDKNGSYAYSAVVPVSFNNATIRLFIYPNPAKEFVVVKYKATTHAAYIKLTDLSGRILKVLPVGKNSIYTKLSLAGVAKGTYQITWYEDNKVESQALLIQ